MRKKLRTEEQLIKNREASKRWYQAHRARAAKSRLVWNRANKKRKAELNRAWNRANPGRKAALSKKWGFSNTASVQKRARKRKRQMPWIISLKNAERRAREKGEAYELSSGWAREVWTGVCAVSGLRFVERPAGKRRGKRGLSLFSVSLDKKIPKLGYTKSNSRFVLYGINLFKNTGTDFEILKIARAIVQHAKNRNR